MLDKIGKEGMESKSYTLKELCRAANVTERTVRYYIKEGLLPSPNGSGAYSRYDDEHFLRLQLIRRLKEDYLPLSEIKTLLAGKTATELGQLASQTKPTVEPSEERLNRVFQPDPASLRQQLIAPVPPEGTGLPLVKASFTPTLRQGQPSATPTRLFFQPPIFQPDEPPPAEEQSQPDTEPVIGDSWERVEIAPGIELHVQKRVARQERETLKILLATARKLFK